MSKPIQIQTVQPEQLESLTTNMMTTNTNQEITGNKVFKGTVAFRACDSKEISHMIYPPYFGDNHQDRIVSELSTQTLENKRLIDPTIIHRVQGEELEQHTDYTLSVPELTSDATIATTESEQTLQNKTLNNPVLKDGTTEYSLTVPTLTNDTTIATTDTEQTLTNKTLGEPALASQTINLNPSNLTNTEISLPAYEGITKYTLLTSQDIENYKTKYVFDEGIYLKAQGFGISHFRMTLHVSNLQDEEAWHNEQITVPYLLAEDESSCATGFLLNTAEPYTLILERKSGNNTITITLPSLHHTISNGDYTIDTLLPTPPSGWITGTQPPVNGVSNQGHSLSGEGAGAEEGGIGVSYTGHYLSWDNDGSGSGSIKVK